MKSVQAPRQFRFHAWEEHGQKLVPALLVAPLVLGLLLFAIYPLIYLLILSSSMSLLGKPFQGWIGADNYRVALTDQPFIDSLLRSIGFAISVTIVELVLGVAIAVLLQRSIRGGHIVRTLILLPLMTPPVMVAVAWKLILSPVGGLLNMALVGWGFTDKPVSVLGSSTWAFPSIAIADAWQWTPFIALLVFAALQVQPNDVHEAATIDGASDWQTFRGITLPILMPALVSIALIRIIMALKLFDLVYALTQGGPGFDTMVGSFHIYRLALEQFNVGYAAALTVLFGLFVSLVTLPVVLLRDWSLRRWS
jgi:multiple sugar transport system permease protein